MISEIYILFFKASLTIRHTATVSQKKSGTSKKIQWDFQISRVGSLDFLDLKVNGSPDLAQVLVKRSSTLGALVSTKTKFIKLIFIRKITLVPVAFLMALSILGKKRRKIGDLIFDLDLTN